MAFDFPDAPAIGDEYISGGATYTWTGLVWDLGGVPTAGDFVEKAGDTMTGALTVQASPTNGGIALRLPTGGEPGHIAWLNGDGTRKAWLGAGAATALTLNLDGATSLELLGGNLYMAGAGGIHWGNNSAVTGITDFSKGICLYGYGGTSQFGLNITSGTLNLSVQNAGNKIDLNVGTSTQLRVQQGTSYMYSNFHCSGLITAETGIALSSAYLSCPEGSQIRFNSTAMFISSTANKNIRYDVGDTAEHGMWVNGTKEFWVSSAGHGLRMPDSFATGLGVTRDDDGGVNMRETLIALLAKIKSMEAEIKTLKARK